MTGASTAGAVLVAAGLLLAAVGLLMMTGGLSWFGRLPGDIRIERETFRLYLPIASMLVVSAGASLLLYLLRRWL